MIASLKGIIASTGIDSAVIEVQGVGFLFSASTSTLTSLGGAGDPAHIHTEMLVAEDSIRLVGFASVEERDWFRLLTSVQGVGARVALAILSVLDSRELHRAIVGQDKAQVARANGVGPKLAERIVRELKDKTGSIGAFGGDPLVAEAGQAAPLPGNAAQDALSALANLGFRPQEASTAVAAAQAELGEEAGLDALVRLALRKAAK